MKKGKKSTNKVIDKVQNYNEETIRNNNGDIKEMKYSIWTIFRHMICDESVRLDEQYNTCSKNSWCT